jgi:hypothetical protein
MPVETHSTVEARNMELMQTLDDAWNAQDLDTFAKRHRKDVVVTWPGKPPTHGIDAHREESIEFFKALPDQKLTTVPIVSSSRVATGPVPSLTSPAP